MDENKAPAGDNQVQATEVSPDTGAGQGNSEKSPAWIEKLPESLKTSKTLAKFTSEEALAKSYVELEAKLGKSLSIPGKDAKPEDWDKFWTKVGRPEQSDKYALEAEGFEADDSVLSDIKTAFHDAGLTQAQADKVFRYMVQKATADSQDEAKVAEANQELLRQAWGSKAPERLELVRRFVSKVGGESALTHLEKIGASKDAVVLQLLAAAADATAPHRFVDGSPTQKAPTPYAYMNKS